MSYFLVVIEYGSPQGSCSRQDIHLEEWSIDADTYCYLDLYKDVFDEILGTKYAQREVEMKMRTHIKGGEHIITTDSDRSLMDMFEQNGDGADHIDLFVDISLLVHVPTETEQRQDAINSIIVILNSSEDKDEV